MTHQSFAHDTKFCLRIEACKSCSCKADQPNSALVGMVKLLWGAVWKKLFNLQHVFLAYLVQNKRDLDQK